MTDERISELPAVTVPALTDEFAVNQAGVSKKMTLAQVAGGDRFASGRYYPAVAAAAGSGGTIVLGTCFAFPFFVASLRAFDALIFQVNTGVASSFVRVGLYGSTNGLPGPLIVDLGQTSGAVAGEKVVAMSQSLQGLVWLAAVGQGVAPNVIRSGAGISPYMSGLSLAAMLGHSYSQTGITAGLPDPWGSTLTIVSANNTAPNLALRAA